MAVDWDKPIRMVFEVGGGSEAVRYLGSRKGPESYKRHIVAVDYGEYEAVLFADDCGRIGDCCRIINTPQRHVRWVNAYRMQPDIFDGVMLCPHASRELADRWSTRDGEDRIACIRIEFEEGEGL